MSEHDDVLGRVRTNLSKMRSTEINALATNEGIREMWQQKQDLLAEMNAAKRRAADAAAAPYREVLAQLDASYAVMLQLQATPDKDEN